MASSPEERLISMTAVRMLNPSYCHSPHGPETRIFCAESSITGHPAPRPRSHRLRDLCLVFPCCDGTGECRSKTATKFLSLDIWPWCQRLAASLPSTAERRTGRRLPCARSIRHKFGGFRGLVLSTHMGGCISLSRENSRPVNASLPGGCRRVTPRFARLQKRSFN
jgi:hypothetical protein